MYHESLEVRIAQLSRGVRGAAAALPEAHADLASRATGAADRLRAAARGATAGLAEDGPAAAGGPRLASGTEEGRVERALEDGVRALEALHYSLLRTTILEEDAGSAEVEEDIEVTLGAAGALAEMLEGEPPGSDPVAEGAPEG